MSEHEISEKRWNQIIDFVNANKPKSELEPPIQNEREDKLFDSMEKELAEKRKTNPKASFAHVDFEWGIVGSHGLYD